MSYFGTGFGRFMILILLGSVLVALFETAGILLIFPLMELVLNPAGAVQGGILGRVYSFLGAPSFQLYLFLVSMFVGIVYFTKSLFQIWFAKMEHRVLAKWKITICYRFFCKFLDADYSYHIQKSSSSTISIIAYSVSVVVNHFIHQSILLCSQIIVGIFICSFLIIRHPLMMTLVAICFLLLFQAQKVAIKNKIRVIGDQINKYNAENYSVLQQGLAAYKETKINLKEKFFQDMFLATNRKLMETEGRMLFFQSLPTSTTELIVMLMTIIAFNMIVLAGDTAQSMTQDLAVVVMSLFRLIPVVNRSLTSVAYINSAVEPLKALLKEADEIDYRGLKRAEAENATVEPLKLTSSLNLHKLTFSYPNAAEPSLRDIDLTIRKGEFVGVIGPSGAGKTTLIAILLGFVRPDSGDYRIDGQQVDSERIRALRHTIGYVDQQPFIFEASIMQNVAFGVELAEIDRNRVEQALRQAELWDFVCSLEKGMETSAGENGKRLSGGQRQRLSIARALYKQPTILILDEATSALDVETEHRISTTIQNLKGSLTIIAIAHRLSTLRTCDRLIMMEDGAIVDSGPYEELLDRNTGFRRLVAISQTRRDNGEDEGASATGGKVCIDQPM